VSNKRLERSWPVFPRNRADPQGSQRRPNQNKPGADLSYFRVEFDERETKAAETFNEIYKEYKGQPTAIRIILPFDEIERMWDAWLEAYTAGRMVARADGEYYVYLIDTDTGECWSRMDRSQNQFARPYHDDQPVGYYMDSKARKADLLQAFGRLKVIIPSWQEPHI